MDDLTELAQSTGFPRISIYLPTHKVYPETEQDRVRFSNAVKEAGKHLAQAGVKGGDELLAPARKRMDEPMFWRHLDHGLAVFIEQGNTRWLKLPTEVAELTVISERYHVLPLIDIFADRGRFHVLAATRDETRFYDGAERELSQVEISDLPAGIADARERTDFDDNVGYHTRGRGSDVAGGTMPKYHALGESPEDYDEVELERYAGDVAKAVDRHLSERANPLVVAARPRLLGRLKQELRYRHLARTGIQRDPASMSQDELHAEAWSIAGPMLRQGRDQTRGRIRARIEGADVPGSEELQDLMAAADDGRVDTLLLQRGAVVWGRYDDTSRKVVVADEGGPDKEDLLNLLAVKTVLQGGKVISLPDDIAARTGPAAGLFRY